VGVAQTGNGTAGTPTEQPDGVDESNNTTSVRVVHLSPLVPPVNVSIEDQQIAANASFGDVEDYQTVPAGEVEVTFVNTESGEELSESDVTLESDSTYTAVVVAERNGTTVAFDPVVLQDGITIPADSNASLRFAHAAPNAPAVDVTLAGTNTTLADNVTVGEDGSYVGVPTGNVTVQVRAESPTNSGAVLVQTNLTVQPGTASTAFAFDSGGNGTSLAVGVTQDAVRETNTTS